jgi:hypothetical protein
MPNAESTIPDTPRRDGKGTIWSHIRQAWFVELSEDVVRHAFVCRLVNDYGFALAQREAAIEAAKTAGDRDARKEREKELNEYRRAMAEKIASESRALLKQRFNYPVFLYEAEHVGITATGEPDGNELYPNDHQPPDGA